MGKNVSEGQGTMRRRTVVKGAAWAAPVVTLGTAAPAEAASPAPIASTVSWTCAKAQRGSWRYTISLSLSNGLQCGTSVRVSTFKVSVRGHVIVSGSRVIEVPAGQSRTVSFTSQTTQQSGPGTGAFTYTYRDCGGYTRQESRAVQLTALASCGGKDRDEGDREKTSTGTNPEGTPTMGTPSTSPASSPEAPTAPTPAATTATPTTATPTTAATD